MHHCSKSINCSLDEQKNGHLHHPTHTELVTPNYVPSSLLNKNEYFLVKFQVCSLGLTAQKIDTSSKTCLSLSGAHSMGRTHCSYIIDRLYNFNGTRKPDPSMATSFVTEMRKLCPQRLKKGQTDPLVFLNQESGSKYKFTQSYYSRIQSQKGVLRIDQQLLYGNDTAQIIEEFAAGFEDFRKSFSLSMSRMGNINVLTGNQGEIRQICNRKNN